MPDDYSATSILNDIWDFSKGVFKTVGDIELDRYEAKRLSALRAAESAQKTTRDDVLAGRLDALEQYLSNTAAQYNTPENRQMGLYIGAGMIGIAVLILLMRR
tara:strand:- start:245 stop:553 length:309 start_codon:yes stop_codon:yes gene_type:complete